MSLSQRQHTTAVCRGGGLNQYQPSGTDGSQRTFFTTPHVFSCGPPLTGSVRLRAADMKNQ
jgi:hypothetical protein